MGSAESGYRTFDQAVTDGNLADGDTVDFMTRLATDWEVARGVYDQTSDTLTRDTILASSNGGAAVDWGAGDKDVMLTASAAFLNNLGSSPLSLSVTRQNVTSTAETDVLTVTVPKNTWADGQVIRFEEFAQYINNTGGNVTYTRKLYAGATSVAAGATALGANAAVRSNKWEVDFVRIGTSVYWFVRNATTTTSYSSSPYSTTTVATPSTGGLQEIASGVDFTADLILKSTLELSAYNASTSYYNTVAARVTLS